MIGRSVVLDPSHRIDPLREHITVDGASIRAPISRVVVALHKPIGVLTSRVDTRGRTTVYDLLGALDTWVFPVGRLDHDSAGLLILTNDNRLGERLTRPESRTPKVYHVRVKGVPSSDALRFLREGVTLRGGRTTRPASVDVLGVAREGEAWLEIALTEGKKRQVRRMCSAVGHDVLCLTRVRIGALCLGDLTPGEWRRLTAVEIERLSLSRSPDDQMPFNLS